MAVNTSIPRFIHRIMPDATSDELSQASERFSAYLAVVRHIYERELNGLLTTDSPKPEDGDTIRA